MNARTRAEAIANALDVLGSSGLAGLQDHADEPLRSLAALTARAIVIHAFERGVVSDGQRVHYLLAHHRTAATAAREGELERRARAFLTELGMSGAPVVVRLLERVSGSEWRRAEPRHRATSDTEIIARTSAIRGTNGRAGVLLEVSGDLSVADEAFVLAHEMRHAWQRLAAPEYRRHEHRNARDRERDADAWAEQAVLRRGWSVPAWARDRDLSGY